MLEACWPSATRWPSHGCDLAVSEKVRARVRITLEYPIECDPSYLEMMTDIDLGEVTHGTWHRSQGTWCAGNLIAELETALRLVEIENDCLCEFIVDRDSVTVEAAV